MITPLPMSQYYSTQGLIPTPRHPQLELVRRAPLSTIQYLPLWVLFNIGINARPPTLPPQRISQAWLDLTPWVIVNTEIMPAHHTPPPTWSQAWRVLHPWVLHTPTENQSGVTWSAPWVLINIVYLIMTSHKEGRANQVEMCIVIWAGITPPPPHTHTHSHGEAM